MIEHQYLCGPCGMDLETLRDCGITLVSHFPWSPDVDKTKRYLERADECGIRLIPYVSPEKALSLNTSERLQRFYRYNPVALSYYLMVDPSTHSEWILIDELGRPSPRYGSYNRNETGEWELDWTRWTAHGQKYHDPQSVNKDTWYMCSSAKGYIDAVERGVRAVMDLGYDGIFVDNTYTRRLATCHGEEYGKHKHRAPDRNTDKTYWELAERIYRTVKGYGQDKMVLLNDGTEDVYAPIRDGSMIESYIGQEGIRWRSHTWEQILSLARRFQDEPKYGRIVTALSYLGSSRHPPRDDCFYAYACAQLSAFKWSARSPRMDIVRLLYRSRLIVPSSDLNEREGLWYRHYDRGMVVVNPDLKQQREVSLPLPNSVVSPVDLYSGKEVPVEGAAIRLSVPPESGRVIVGRRDAENNYLLECPTTMCLALRQLQRQPELDSSRLSELRQATLHQATAWANELLTKARARQAGSTEGGAARIKELLTNLQAHFASLKSSEDSSLQQIGHALDHGRYAANLIQE